MYIGTSTEADKQIAISVTRCSARDASASSAEMEKGLDYDYLYDQSNSIRQNINVKVCLHD